MSGAYHCKYTCRKCEGHNQIEVKDTDGGVISECSTKCSDCGHEDYWGYGFFIEEN